MDKPVWKTGEKVARSSRHPSFKAGPLDLSFLSFFASLHHGIDVERPLL